MDKKSKFNSVSEKDFLHELSLLHHEGIIYEKIAKTISVFFNTYKQALTEQGKSIDAHIPIFFDFLECIKRQIESPFSFENYNKKISHPFDYHKFGINFFKPLVKESSSYLVGKEHVKEIESLLEKKENVILLGNHQIEPDPQALFILLQKESPKLIDHLIFVAGERVITDPVAVPFSLGCNLLCIYSKRYIDNPPEKKGEKQFYNSKTMKMMKSLLDSGGCCIYVAPSGGRDRKDENGRVYPAPFDPQSIEMFHLIGRHSLQPTHFFPLALATYSLLPPPETIQKELGETRTATASSIRIAFGKKINMDQFPGSTQEDKALRRKAKSDYIYNMVCSMYEQLS